MQGTASRPRSDRPPGDRTALPPPGRIVTRASPVDSCRARGSCRRPATDRRTSRGRRAAGAPLTGETVGFRILRPAQPRCFRGPGRWTVPRLCPYGDVGPATDEQRQRQAVELAHAILRRGALRVRLTAGKKPWARRAAWPALQFEKAAQMTLSTDLQPLVEARLAPGLVRDWADRKRCSCRPSTRGWSSLSGGPTAWSTSAPRSPPRNRASE
jgi:hypothetical protein